MAERRLSIWPPLPPSVWWQRPLDHLPFPLEEPGTRVFAWARQGLWHGVHALGLGAPDEVLVPAYHHGSEIEVLQRAGLGLRWYGTGALGEPDESELDELLAPGVRALYLIHHLGVPKRSARWRRWCDERGLLLVEDAAQAWLASSEGAPVGATADLALFCLYKTVGLPEGAAAVARVPLPEPAPNRAPGAADLLRRHGAWVAQRSAGMAGAAERMRQERAYVPGEDMGLGDPDGGPWATTGFLLRRLADPSVAHQRRLRHVHLSGELGGLPPGAEPLPPGASPFVYPLTAEDGAHKAALLARLASNGIKALDLWSVAHPALPVGRFPAVDDLRSRVVGLPVHQELGAPELSRIVAAVDDRAAAVPSMRLETLRGLDALPAAWDELALASGNVFANRRWLSIWWKHFGSTRPELTACRRGDGSVAALIPLHRTRLGPLRVLRFLGGGPGDRLGPICAPGDEPLAAAGLGRLLVDDDGWDVLLAERLPGDAGWPLRLGGHRVRRESSPVLEIDGRSWDEVLASWSSNLRQQIRRHERNVFRDHAARYRLCTDPDRLAGDLEALFSLHERRWGGPTPFTDDRAFHAEIAHAALAEGWLRLWLLEIDGRPAAAWYGFRFAGSEAYYQSGRDPALDPSRVGFVLLCHSIREAVVDGMDSYRFLRGEESYKGRFTTTDAGVETLVSGGTAPGRLAAAAAAATTSLPGPLQRRLAGTVR